MKKISLFFMMLLLCKLSFSELVVNLSNSSPSKYEVFNLEVSFVNEDKEKYKIEGIDNFDVLSRGSSNSYNVINGKTTSMKSDVYRLKPKNDGEFTLKVITDNGVEKIVNIKVLENKELDKVMVDRFTLQSNLPKEVYYFGEKIPFSENFISTVNISSFSQVKAPDFQDFSVKDITPYNNNSYVQKQINYNGKQAIDLTIFKGILQANSSGEKTITTGEVKVGQPTRDFFYENTTLVGGKDIKINIKPLPVDQPANFKDIVGTLKFDEIWKGKEVNVGQAITLTLTLYGSGNLSLIDKLPLESNNEFNVFQSVKSYNEEIRDDQYFNEKVFEIAFIPKKGGVEKTPEIIIPYFNTNTEKYEDIIIPSQDITVKGNNNIQNTVSDNRSPIQNNNEKITSQQKGGMNNNANSSNNLKEVNIKLLETEKTTNKNIYKLAFGIITLLSLAELLVIIYLVLDRKKFKNNKKR
ncbi:BatD family protein [Candidatus Cetobacterium colombiensis]|uniref:BatD family protein n=1 Tax=Candidatus Cetobacterium colombiensis TaxID=3073100 RepID=A0ABU4W618_9FUSO|nr:BatD family protein [Candidatus Cetobacterium colombiensis]MDX8334980.1 BatD family protein [Candidatus Cetobacterium colombiensis]